MDKEEVRKGLMLAVKVSLFSNITLFSIKAVSFFVVNSLAVAADLGISGVALGISLFLYYAIRMSDKPADAYHNYGYSKVENVTEAVEGVILIGLALAMSVQAAMHLVHPGQVRRPLFGLIASTVCSVIYFSGSRFILRLGIKHDSPALRAEGLHFRLEGFISISIMSSFVLYMILTRAGWPGVARYVDPVATLIVSALITVPSVRLLKEAFVKLLDASIEESGQMDIMKVLAAHFEKYCAFNNIRTRTAGRKRFVDLDLIVPRAATVEEAHRLAAAVKSDIASSLAESEVVIHLEPCGGDCAFLADNQACPYLEPAGITND
jgi:cation diffusion facilitator family transporter